MTEWQKTKCARAYNIWRYADLDKTIIELQLPTGITCIFDAVDHKILNRKWCRHTQGPDSMLTAVGSSNGVLMHNLILGVKGVDHINGNRLDNRRVNLRAATTKLNNNNVCMKKNNKSGINGVYDRASHHCWVASGRCPDTGEKITHTYGYGVRASITYDEAKILAVAKRIEMDQLSGCKNGQRPKHIEQTQEFIL